MTDDPRDELLAVAREIIEKRGYLGLSMRTAAAAAGVTEHVARRYYRNRDSLFAAALRLPVDPASALPTLVAPGLEGMGERLVRFTLDVLKDPQARDDLFSLARTGVHAGHAALGVQDFLERGVIDRIANAIGVPDARMRSALISSYLLGIAMSRYVVRLEPLASASEEEVVRMVAPVIQDLLDPRRPITGSSRARAAGREQRTGTAATAAGQRVPPRPEPTQPAPAPTPPPKPFDPDPGRSSVSSVELLGMGAANLSATTMQVAANALRAAAVAASKAGAQPSTARPRSGTRAPERGATTASRPASASRPTPPPPGAESAPAARPAAADTPKPPRRSAATKRTAAASSSRTSATGKSAGARSATTRSTSTGSTSTGSTSTGSPTTKRTTAKSPTRRAPTSTTGKPTRPAPKETPALETTAKKHATKKGAAVKPGKSPQNHPAAPADPAAPSAPAKASAAPSHVEPSPAEERPTGA